MYGWVIAYDQNDTFKIPAAMEKYALRNREVVVIYGEVNKFKQDHLLKSDEAVLIGTEGVLLNSAELKQQYHIEELYELLKQLYNDNALFFLRSLRGPYCGFIYDYRTKKATIFTNRVGDRPVYYYNKANIFIASSNLNMLIDFCRFNGLALSFSEAAGTMLLQKGFMLDERTMVQEITRLFPGTCLVWCEAGWHTERYHALDSTEDFSITEEQAIEEIDRLFRQAVKRQFDKDLEYGYEHLADISGGMDSRMTTWVARDMGYGPFVNVNYGMPGCLDFKLAAKMAAELGNEFIFKSLADFSFIYDIDETVYRNFGSAIYVGPTGTLRLVKEMNTNNIGIRHNGNVGGTPFGLYLKADYHEKPNASVGKGYSNLEIGNSEIDLSRYQTLEEQKLYSRCFLGVTASHILMRDYVTAVSPFLDGDLLDYLLHVPVKYRRGHRIYGKWVKAKYPRAAEYPWNSPFFRVYHNAACAHFVSASCRKSLDILQQVLGNLCLSKYRYRLAGMNPLEALYERNEQAQRYLNDYYRNHVSIFDHMPEFGQKVKTSFEQGGVHEKALALMTISFAKQHRLL